MFWIGMPTPFVEFSVPRRSVRYRGFASVVVKDSPRKCVEIFTCEWGSSCRDLPENDAETVDLGCFGESPVSKGFWCHVWYHAANVRETEFWFGSRECEVAQFGNVVDVIVSGVVVYDESVTAVKVTMKQVIRVEISKTGCDKLGDPDPIFFDPI